MAEENDPTGMGRDPMNPDGALGFETKPANPNEKYNTMYLASHLQKDQRNTKLIVLAVVGAVILGALAFVVISGNDDRQAAISASGETAPGSASPTKVEGSATAAAAAPVPAPAPATGETAAKDAAGFSISFAPKGGGFDAHM